MRKLLTVLIVAALAAASRGQDETPAPAAKGIAWEPVFDKALAKAKAENRPVMVAFILRGESANEEICGDHFVHPELIELSRRFVCLFAFATYRSSDTSEATATSDAYVKTIADRVTLPQLRKLEMAARVEYMDSGLVSAPQFIFLNPDGETVLLRHVWMLPAEQLVMKMHKALSFFDPDHEMPKVLVEESKEETKEIDELLVVANDNNMNTRREAMRKLATKDHPRVVQFLIKQTDKEIDRSRRLEAVRAMGQRGQAKYLPRLHHMLVKEASYQIRTNVAEALSDIGLVESTAMLSKILKKEKKKQVRSLLISSLMTCGGAREEVTKDLAKILSRGDDMDRITIMYRLASSPWNEAYAKPLAKNLKSSNAQVRAAAYYVIGSHKLEAMKKKVKSKVSSEKGIAKNASAWAYKELGGNVEGEPENPSSDISMLMPSANY